MPYVQGVGARDLNFKEPKDYISLALDSSADPYTAFPSGDGTVFTISGTGEAITYDVKECGMLIKATDAYPDDTMACGYLSITGGDQKKAAALKAKLAPLANMFAAMTSDDEPWGYGITGFQADQPVWMAYAVIEGPIAVLRYDVEERYDQPPRPFMVATYMRRGSTFRLEDAQVVVTNGRHFQQLVPRSA